jgi:hypothetical protein
MWHRFIILYSLGSAALNIFLLYGILSLSLSILLGDVLMTGNGQSVLNCDIKIAYFIIVC